VDLDSVKCWCSALGMTTLKAEKDFNWSAESISTFADLINALQNKS
jgi:hypothetical protein